MACPLVLAFGVRLRGGEVFVVDAAAGAFGLVAALGAGLDLVTAADLVNE